MSEPIVIPLDQNNPDPIVETPAPTRTFTVEEVERIRQEEKDKLYPQLDEVKSQLKTLQQEREERLNAAEQARKAAEEQARKAAEEEMSARELIELKDREHQAKLAEMEQRWEASEAARQREVEYNQLQVYIAQRKADETQAIHPALIDLVGGNSVDEVEQNIVALQERTNLIVQDFQSLMDNPPTIPRVQGVRVTAPPSDQGPPQNKTYTAEQIKNMTMEEFRANRGSLLGRGTNAQGLF